MAFMRPEAKTPAAARQAVGVRPKRPEASCGMRRAVCCVLAIVFIGFTLRRMPCLTNVCLACAGGICFKKAKASYLPKNGKQPTSFLNIFYHQLPLKKIYNAIMTAARSVQLTMTSRFGRSASFTTLVLTVACLLHRLTITISATRMTKM